MAILVKILGTKFIEWANFPCISQNKYLPISIFLKIIHPNSIRQLFYLKNHRNFIGTI